MFSQAYDNYTITQREGWVSGNPCLTKSKKRTEIYRETFSRRKWVRDRGMVQIGSKVNCVFTRAVADKDTPCHAPTDAYFGSLPLFGLGGWLIEPRKRNCFVSDNYLLGGNETLFYVRI